MLRNRCVREGLTKFHSLEPRFFQFAYFVVIKLQSISLFWPFEKVKKVDFEVFLQTGSFVNNHNIVASGSRMNVLVDIMLSFKTSCTNAF